MGGAGTWESLPWVSDAPAGKHRKLGLSLPPGEGRSAHDKACNFCQVLKGVGALTVLPWGDGYDEARLQSKRPERVLLVIRFGVPCVLGTPGRTLRGSPGVGDRAEGESQLRTGVFLVVSMGRNG